MVNSKQSKKAKIDKEMNKILFTINYFIQVIIIAFFFYVATAVLAIFELKYSEIGLIWAFWTGIMAFIEYAFLNRILTMKFLEIINNNETRK